MALVGRFGEEVADAGLHALGCVAAQAQALGNAVGDAEADPIHIAL